VWEYAPLVVLTALDDMSAIAPLGFFTVMTTAEEVVGVGVTVPDSVITDDPEKVDALGETVRVVAAKAAVGPRTTSNASRPVARIGSGFKFAHR
jgi:hypothetical protein